MEVKRKEREEERARLREEKQKVQAAAETALEGKGAHVKEDKSEKEEGQFLRNIIYIYQTKVSLDLQRFLESLHVVIHVSTLWFVILAVIWL